MGLDRVWIRETIERLRLEWRVPGTAVGIVHEGETILNEGFGLRDVAKGLPVTPETLFAVGSTTKAFVATALGILVDEGRLAWDTPVREYLPNFKLFDSFATERMTPRDLLTHRSGLPRHEKMWYNSPASRAELVQRLRYLQPAYDFRTVWHYQNMMFVTAGYLVEVITGQTWENFTRERILKPLGMKATNFSVDDSEKFHDAARPYLIRKGSDTPEEIPFYNLDNCGPAGSINSNLNDFLTWLHVNLNEGKYANGVIVKPETLAEIHKPQMVIHDPAYKKITGEDFLTYALGWFVGTYRGHTIVRHSGGIDGFITQFGFLPAKKTGVVIFSNLNETSLPGVLMYTLLDHLLGLEPRDWNGRLRELNNEFEDGQEKAHEASWEARIKDTRPSHALADFVGVYEHPGYGLAQIEWADEGKTRLQVRLNNMPSPLTHYHYDVFELFNDLYEDNRYIKLNFFTALDGTIGGFSAQLELTPGIEAIRFVRKVGA